MRLDFVTGKFSLHSCRDIVIVPEGCHISIEPGVQIVGEGFNINIDGAIGPVVSEFNLKSLNFQPLTT